MSRRLGIDPGSHESAYALIDEDTRRPLEVGILSTPELMEWLGSLCLDPERFALNVDVEMVESYGMPVGNDVFETCVVIGRIIQQIMLFSDGTIGVVRTSRSHVRQRVCRSNRATDANVTAALVERFAPETSNKGKGTKSEPGWFYGFRTDIWQAYALAVCRADES